MHIKKQTSMLILWAPRGILRTSTNVRETRLVSINVQWLIINEHLVNRGHVLESDVTPKNVTNFYWFLAQDDTNLNNCLHPKQRTFMNVLCHHYFLKN